MLETVTAVLALVVDELARLTPLLHVELFIAAPKTKMPVSFFWREFVGALRIKAVSSVAMVPLFTAMPTVAALILRVRPVSV